VSSFRREAGNSRAQRAQIQGRILSARSRYSGGGAERGTGTL
jgi:hypothetical protein